VWCLVWGLLRRLQRENCRGGYTQGSFVLDGPDLSEPAGANAEHSQRVTQMTKKPLTLLNPHETNERIRDGDDLKAGQPIESIDVVSMVHVRWSANPHRLVTVPQALLTQRSMLARFRENEIQHTLPARLATSDICPGVRTSVLNNVSISRSWLVVVGILTDSAAPGCCWCK
jgi:hypothetical protein